MKKQPLTHKQKKYLNFIKDFIAKNDHSPTRQDIADHFDTGLNNAGRYIDFLCKKGWIEKDFSVRPPVLKVL